MTTTTNIINDLKNICLKAGMIFKPDSNTFAAPDDYFEKYVDQVVDGLFDLLGFTDVRVHIMLKDDFYSSVLTENDEIQFENLALLADIYDHRHFL